MKYIINSQMIEAITEDEFAQRYCNVDPKLEQRDMEVWMVGDDGNEWLIGKHDTFNAARADLHRLQFVEAMRNYYDSFDHVVPYPYSTLDVAIDRLLECYVQEDGTVLTELVENAINSQTDKSIAEAIRAKAIALEMSQEAVPA